MKTIILTTIILIFLYIFLTKKIKSHNDDLKTCVLEIVENIELYNKITPSDYLIEYPIFYINMDKHTNRRKYMEDQLDKVASVYQRVQGFNGYKITDRLSDTVDGISFTNKYENLTNAELGCVLSHILAIKQAYDYSIENSKDIAIICEDDTYFGTYKIIPKLSEIVEGAPGDWNIIKLYSGFEKYDKYFSNFYPKNGGYIFVKRQYPLVFWSTVCYIINVGGMKNILDSTISTNQSGGIQINIKPLVGGNSPKDYYPPYGFSDCFIYDLVDSTYSVVPNLFTVNNIELDSTIHKDHTTSHLKQSKTRLDYFDNMIKDKIKKDLIIYCFWTGDNELTKNRKKSLKQLEEKSGGTVLLITPSNLKSYILPEHPLHPSYNYLSEVHKSDYLRTYFMHHYGGGYSDIKRTRGNWIKAYLKFLEGDQWICGYPEIAGGVAYPPLTDQYHLLVGNCAYICRPRTPLTEEWYNSMIELLDSKYLQLKENPAAHPLDCYPSDSGYPLEWNEMLGRIFHRVCYQYKDKILNILPPPNFEEYR